MTGEEHPRRSQYPPAAHTALSSEPYVSGRECRKTARRRDPVYFTLQNMSEFWNVATRPAANNGLGFSVALALVEMEKIERFLTVLPDSPAAYGEWKRLVVRHKVIGSKVHDAKLVAAMNVNGLRRILTFNTEDFARYEIEAIHPSSLLNLS